MTTRILLPLLFLATPLLAFAHGGVDDSTLIIRMTPNGFEPQELTAVAGDEIIFINNDDVDRWPASDSHPTHEIYPEFDSKKRIKPGVAWKFTFTKAGTWGMHDHLQPNISGTITILEDTTEQVPLKEEPEPSNFFSKLRSFFLWFFKE